LGGNETILHGVRHPHCRLASNDASRTFQRMGRPHQFFEPLSRVRILLQSKKAFRQDTRLGLHLHAKKLKHG
jgi:hypothetical protein